MEAEKLSDVGGQQSAWQELIEHLEVGFSVTSCRDITLGKAILFSILLLAYWK